MATKPITPQSIAEEFKELTGQEAATCRKCKRPVYQNFQDCYRHLRGKDREVAKNPATRTAATTRFGLYGKELTASMLTIRANIEAAGELDKLFDTGILEELALSRLFLAGWMNNHKEDDDIPLKDIMVCLDILGKIAKQTLEIERLRNAANEIPTEALNAIMMSIAYAFHKANTERDAALRAEVFAREVSKIFGGGVDTFDSAPLSPTELRDQPVRVGDGSPTLQ